MASREDSPDYGVGYITEDHPLRPMGASAEQTIRLLQVPTGSGHLSRGPSISSSVTDMEAPIYQRETAGRQHMAESPAKNEAGISDSKDDHQRQAADGNKPRGAGDQTGFNGRLAFAIIAAALGSSFQHGYNTGVVNAPQKLIEDWIRNVEIERTGIPDVDQSKVTMIWSIAVSIFCFGGMIGGIATGYVADRFGRKGGLLMNNVFVIASVILQGASKSCNSYEMVIAGRFLIGINSGLNAGLAPMYLAEISPVHLRGAVGTVYQLVITVSILISNILGLSSMLGTEDKWPILLSITVVPALFQLATLPLCPESPKYILLGRGQEVEAQRALSWLRGTIEVHDEMDEMRNEYESMKSVPKVGMREMFTNSMLRMPLIIAIMIMVGQQLSGINAVIFFSTKIFELAKLDASGAQYATLGLGTVNVLMTVVSLVLVERAGRKTLLLVGFAGMFVDTVLLTFALANVENALWVSYLSIFLVYAFVVLFAVGPGSIPWFLVSELFNQSARPTATSIAVGVNWTANFFVGLGFLPLQEVMKVYVFIIFAILLALFTVFVYFKVPETKNKTMEEISSMFRQRSYQ